jgi:hypothetical protein
MKCIRFYPMRWLLSSRHRNMWSQISGLYVNCEFEVLSNWPHNIDNCNTDSCKALHISKVICVPTLALNSTNQSSFYPSWHTATTDDTTNLHSEGKVTAQHRILSLHTPKHILWHFSTIFEVVKWISTGSVNLLDHQILQCISLNTRKTYLCSSEPKLGTN